MEALEAALAATGDAVAGTVRLAVFQSAALGIVPQALTLLRRGVPALRVEITQREPESALAAVWAREFDLVIAEQYPGHAAPRLAELDREPLCGDELRLAARDPGHHGDRGRARGGLGDGTAGHGIRHWAEQLCRVAGFEPDAASRPRTCRRTSGSWSRGTRSPCCPIWCGAAARRACGSSICRGIRAARSSPRHAWRAARTRRSPPAAGARRAVNCSVSSDRPRPRRRASRRAHPAAPPTTTRPGRAGSSSCAACWAPGANVL